jgi:ribosomal protein S18 acetylase RimI-like enzyme
LVAEIDNRIVGFVLGRAGEFELGLPGTIAWIEIIGVDPAYRAQGIAQELVGQFAESPEDHGIKTIFTLSATARTTCSSFSASRVSFMARCCTIKRSFPVKQRLWNF